MRPILDVAQLEHKRVLVVGDVMLDTFVYGEVSRISPEAPIPVLSVTRTEKMPGGAANVAVNVAALRASVVLMGVTGADTEGAMLAQLLRQFSSTIIADFLVDPERPTTAKTRYIGKSQQMLRADNESVQHASSKIEDEAISRLVGHLDTCDAVIVSDYSKGFLTDRILRELMSRANKLGKPVIVDPKRAQFDAYKGASYIKPNVSELSRASGIDAVTDASATIAAETVIRATGAAILLTRSEKGMALFRDNSEAFFIRTAPSEIFDVSGAGDTACAAFAVGIAAGLTAQDAAVVANTAAGLSVTKLGTAFVAASELQAALSDNILVERVSRIASLEHAVAVRNNWKSRGLKVGFTNGCFDILHSGHVSLLNAAASACDRLIVAINSDESVRRLKGPGRPAQDESSRLQVMASLAAVDLVTVFDEDTPLRLIEALAPDYLIKGADYKENEVVGADIVKAAGGSVLLVDLVSDVSTTRTINRINAQSARG
jgi:D-beta-D-heptose 7-phosphate kinase/D-beta-D-heptose 1-phosphate adenosyltransferase